MATTEDDLPFDLSDEEYHEVISSIMEDTAEDKEHIIHFFTHLRTKHELGENVQGHINDFFDENSGIFILFSIGMFMDIADFVEEYGNEISDESTDDLIEIWEAVQWAEDSALAFNQSTYDTAFWTEKRMNFETGQDGETLVDVKMQWGVDELFDAKVPFDMFLEDAVSRLERIDSWWDGEEEEVPRIFEQDMQQMEEIPEKLRMLADSYEDNLDEIELVEMDEMGVIGDE